MLRLVAEKIADDVESRFRVEVGRVHDQGVSFPPATRIAHIELHVRCDVRPAVQRDDSKRVILIPDEHHIAGSLKNPERRKIVQAGHTGHQTPRLRINVLGPGRIFVHGVEFLLQRSRPRLIRNVAVWWVHDPARIELHDSGYPLFEVRRTALRGVQGMGSADDRTPGTLHVGLAVGRQRRGPRPGQLPAAGAPRPGRTAGPTAIPAPRRSRKPSLSGAISSERSVSHDHSPGYG